MPMFREDILKGHPIAVAGGGTGLGKSMATAFAARRVANSRDWSQRTI